MGPATKICQILSTFEVSNILKVTRLLDTIDSFPKSTYVKVSRLKETQTFSDIHTGHPVAMHLDEVGDVGYEVA